MELSNLNIKNGLCISLGANINSKFGSPTESLIKIKPEVELIIYKVLTDIDINASRFSRDSHENLFNWSSLYQTFPQGIQDTQPDFINCLLLVNSKLLDSPSVIKAKLILQEFEKLEREFGRIKSNKKRWLPRCLDIDILWWDNLIIDDDNLTLPHPRLFHRNFVISPLSEILSKSQKIEKLNISLWNTN